MLLIVGYVRCAAPLDSTLVFSKGEGDYYCQKIPYLLTTAAGALIAFAEGRGRYNGTSCDDFKVNVSIFLWYCRWFKHRFVCRALIWYTNAVKMEERLGLHLLYSTRTVLKQNLM